MEAGRPRRESFDIAGCRISAVLAGDPNSPAVLLLHGFPSSSRTFRNVIPRLSETCFVIAPDLPGFGQSDLVADPSFARFADLIEGLLEALGVERAYLYVHDFGAPVALDLAMRDPRRVRGLIVQNANAHRTGFRAAVAGYDCLLERAIERERTTRHRPSHLRGDTRSVCRRHTGRHCRAHFRRQLDRGLAHDESAWPP